VKSTSIHLVTELRKTVASVRVIARSTDRLVRLFPETAVEKWPADVLDAAAAPEITGTVKPITFDARNLGASHIE
jgi:hypothetical protein